MNTYSPVNIGNRYGRLVVVSGPDPRRVGKSQQKRYYFTCICDCGKESIVDSAKLKVGWTTSCGCKHADNGRARLTTHGDTDTRLHDIWCSIRGRCFNIRNRAYDRYGGRGIVMCDAWKKDFTSFRDWATANGYADHLSIDRINNDGNYEPSNCRWATPTEQARNKRNSLMISAFGQTKCVAEWAEDERCIVPAQRLYERLKRGWSLEKSMITPPQEKDQSWRRRHA